MDYVQKPFTEDELVDFVNKSLIRRQDRIEKLTKPQVHLITPAIKADKSKRVVNVPSGVFVAPCHTWINIEMNGSVRVGLDDFALKLLGPIDSIELPKKGQTVAKGDVLFTIGKENHRLGLHAPVSGSVSSINTELLERMDYLKMKPYELGWICTLTPSNLPGDLHSLTVGADSVDWYKEEINKFNETLARLTGKAPDRETAEEERKRIEEAVWKAFEKVCLSSGPGS
jgi:glycine cleavage system H lipoate-binding protein